MRAILHTDRDLLDEAVGAVSDLIDAERASMNGQEGGRRGGWRGTTSVGEEEIVVEATHRTASLRRRMRVVAPTLLASIAVGQDDAPPPLHALRAIADALSRAEPDGDGDEAALAALTLDSELAGWLTAVVHPGAPWAAPRIAVEFGDGSIRRLGATAAAPAERMPDELAAALTDASFHVYAFRTGNELRVRIGTAAPLKLVNPGPMEAFNLAMRAEGRRQDATER